MKLQQEALPNQCRKYIGSSVTNKRPMQPTSCLLRAATDMEPETGYRTELFTVLGVFGQRLWLSLLCQNTSRP